MKIISENSALSVGVVVLVVSGAVWITNIAAQVQANADAQVKMESKQDQTFQAFQEIRIGQVETNAEVKALKAKVLELSGLIKALKR